jgi:hypothetical protein
MATISNTPRPGYVWDSTDNVWYPIGTGPHTHADYITSGSAINPNIVDAKGDIIAATAADTVARLAVGANDTVLTADSSTATGLKWATPASGADFTLLNTGGTALTGAQTITVNVSGKNQIYIYIDRASSASASSFMRWRLNTDTGNNYYYYATGNDVALYDGGGAANFIYAGRMGTADGNLVSGYILIDGCNKTGIKPFVSAGSGTGTSARYYTNVGHYAGTSAITSVSFNSETGNFDSGTMYVYGA